MTFMLWYELKSPMPERVANALAYFEKKYGTPPNVVETSFQEEPLQGMNLIVSRVSIPKGHILVGRKEEKTEKKDGNEERVDIEERRLA